MDEPASGSYRTSHASPGYGDLYSRTYEHGYYADQWRLIEKPLLESVFAALDDRDKASYLDFACGTGRILGVGESWFDDSTGVDISPEMLRVAADACTGSRLICQDITKTPLTGTYDVITAFRFFLNAEPALANDVLRALYALLPEQNGKLILNIHVNRKSPLGMVYETRNRITGRKTANTKDYDEFNAILERHGFVIEKAHWYGFLPRFGWKFERTSKYLMLPVERLFRLLPFCNRFAQCYLLQCRKI